MDAICITPQRFLVQPHSLRAPLVELLQCSLSSIFFFHVRWSHKNKPVHTLLALVNSEANCELVFESLPGAVIGLRCTSSMAFHLRGEPDPRFGLALRGGGVNHFDGGTWWQLAIESRRSVNPEGFYVGWWLLKGAILALRRLNGLSREFEDI